MNRNKKLIRNIIIILLIFFLNLYLSGFYLNPKKAHLESEKSLGYGPSEIVHIEDYELGKYLLSRYEDYFSLGSVKNYLKVFYRIGSYRIGEKVDKSEDINFNYSIDYSRAEKGYGAFYGVRNNELISKIEIGLSDGTIESTNKFYDDMFLIKWNVFHSTENSDRNVDYIRGYDNHGNVIYINEIYKKYD